MQPWAERFYCSRAWKRCRRSYISSRINIDGGRCEICGFSQGYIVHHKVLLTPTNIDDPVVSLNHDNLQYVCKDCHDLFDGHGLRHNTTPNVVTFDADGNPIGRTSPPV